MKEHEATNLRDALKRFDAWVGTTVGGKDDHIAADLRLIGNHARERLALHDKDEAEATAALAMEEEAARTAEAERIATEAAKAEADAAEKARADEAAEAQRIADANAAHHDDANTTKYRE